MKRIYLNQTFLARGRDYECTNIVAVVTEKAMGTGWTIADESALNGLTMIERCAGVEYWGYL